MTVFVPLSSVDQTSLLNDHPGFDVSTLPAIPAGFSYDTGFPGLFPRWVKGEGNLRLALWVNHLQPASREAPESNRYLLFVDDDRCICLASSESWEEVTTRIGFVSAIFEGREPGMVDTRAVAIDPEYRSFLEGIRRDAFRTSTTATKAVMPAP